MRRLGGRLAALLAASGAAFCVLPAHALAVAECAQGPTAKRTLLSGRGTLESAIVDQKGRLFFTDSGVGGVVRMDTPDSEPVTLAGNLGEGLGGLAVRPDGKLILGLGNSFGGGLAGNVAPSARLVIVDPDTGTVEPYAKGLQMANGVELASDGTVYASNDFGFSIDRVLPGGKVEVGWAPVQSPNGMAIDSSGRYLFASQTFRPAAIARIEIATGRSATYAQPGSGDFAAGPDGMAIDDDDRLLVPANLAGQAWRVGTDGSICALARGLGQPSDIAVGRGDRGFRAGNAYVVGFAGELVELAGVAAVKATAAPEPPATASASVSFTPRTARVRRGRTRFVPRLRAGGREIHRRLLLRATGHVRRIRSGRPVTIRTGSARRIAVTFTFRGNQRRRTIRLRR